MSVKEKRLNNDFQALSELVANSGGTLAIISTNGNPVYQYIIEYHCKGIEKIENNQAKFRTSHRIEIILGNNYPRERASAKFITPIFHPNVYTNLNICLGSSWSITETVSELVLRIGKIIQYAEDITNLNSPANANAKSWAMNNQALFPLDNQTFKSQITPQIAWQDF
jgi:ubiquitin-protein ligase